MCITGVSRERTVTRQSWVQKGCTNRDQFRSLLMLLQASPAKTRAGPGNRVERGEGNCGTMCVVLPVCVCRGWSAICGSQSSPAAEGQTNEARDVRSSDSRVGDEPWGKKKGGLWFGCRETGMLLLATCDVQRLLFLRLPRLHQDLQLATGSDQHSWFLKLSDVPSASPESRCANCLMSELLSPCLRWCGRKMAAWGERRCSHRTLALRHLWSQHAHQV